MECSTDIKIILYKNIYSGISPVAQWIRIHLLMQGHGFDPWSGKVPHATEQVTPCTTTTEPALYSSHATTTEPACCNY